MDKVTLTRDEKAVWIEMNESCFTPDLLNELNVVGGIIGANAAKDDGYSFQVLTSSCEVFSYGGDLDYFVSCVRSGDKEALWKYSRLCLDVLNHAYAHYNAPLTTIAVVQGDALGGGFECALSHSVVIAEEQARFGLPETKFGLFPGMGAVSLLSRKVGFIEARRMVLSGRTYSALEMYDRGIVDDICPEGGGRLAAQRYIDGFHEKQRVVRTAFECIDPATPAELYKIADLWVDLAMNISPINQRLMLRLAEKQKKLSKTHREKLKKTEVPPQ